MPPENQINATKRLIEEGVKLGKIAENYNLYGQRQLIRATDSPGLALYEIIQKWDHELRYFSFMLIKPIKYKIK